MVVDPAQKMIGRHALIEAEIVEERRRSRLKSNHHLIPANLLRIESVVPSACNNELFNSIAPKRTVVRKRLQAIFAETNRSERLSYR